MTTTTTTPGFEPPGKGEWRSLADHFPRACTPEFRLLLTEGMEQGEADHFAAYGMPARCLTPRFVHGHVYIAAVPLVGRASNGLPPKPLLWLAARLHPSFRARERAARRALAEGLAVADARQWWDVDRAAWAARVGELDAVDPALLDDGALAAHLRAARALAGDGYAEHFRLHGCDLLPTALLLVWAGDHGLPAADVLAALVGFSPASVGDEPAPAWRLVSGYDLDSRAAGELPPLPAAPRRERVGPADDDSLLLAPFGPAGRDELARLLADARATYGVRDDNGLLTAAWPVGLLRRAMLEAGRRAFGDAERGVEATVDELAGLLLGAASAPTKDDVADRAVQRAADSALVPPPVLGPEIGLPVAALPPGMRRVARALLALRDLGTSTSAVRPPLHGDGIGRGRATGPAVVADDPGEALGRVEPGVVLVARGTTPAWNAVLSLVAAVVVEEGGPLGHAAIVARELGIPAVVGVAGAVDLVPDGALVEVDAATGRVTVVGQAPA